MASPSAASTGNPSATASGHAPASGHEPATAPTELAKKKRPSRKELADAMNKILGKDAGIMADTLKNGCIFGSLKCVKIVEMVMESMPNEYPWMPTVPPCL